MLLLPSAIMQRVKDDGIKVQGVRSSVRGLRCKVWGVWLKVHKFRVWGYREAGLGIEAWARDTPGEAVELLFWLEVERG